MNTVSAGKGPEQAMPRAAPRWTAGAMISISSRPKSPFSPPCGLSAATAMRGRAKPAPRMVASASVSASSMRSGVIWSSAARSDTCEVTRDIHLLSSTFISPKKPSCWVMRANIWCSSLNFHPPAWSAALLSGPKTMPSMRPASASPIIASSVSPAIRPARGEIAPTGVSAGSRLPKSTIGISSAFQSTSSGVEYVRQSMATPASRAPRARRRVSPTTRRRAASASRMSARMRAHSSGPMPVESPSMRPRSGSSGPRRRCDGFPRPVMREGRCQFD